jgi:chromosome segregation protein
MRLRSLEIKGFKSFADHTVINFNEDVIGIVGPNGSGKSNIVDAIRWVLGEQKSKELRLDKMNSVIFNGTKKRKPGQLAQVTLTFDNTKNVLPTDYQSVAISRILYASGDSEYRLNNIPCRLKDITNLFLDTGIGSNSYAIIALGMVDDILNDKENSRRYMLEQAAGISKFKARKQETINKLNTTTEDLNRIEDLLYEIDGNLKTLEKQARRTQKYFELKEEYKTLSIDLSVLKLSQYKDDYKLLEKKIETDTDQYRTNEISSTKIEADIEKLKKNNLENEQLLSERQREMNQLVGSIRNIENDKRLAQQKLEFINQNKSTLANSLSQLAERITYLQKDIDVYSTEVNEEKRVEARLELELDKAQQELDDVKVKHNSFKSSIENNGSEMSILEKQVNERETQLAVNTNTILNLKSELESFNFDSENQMQTLDNLKLDVQIQNKKEEEFKSKITDLNEKEDKRTEQQKQIETKINNIKEDIATQNRTLDSKRNEFKLTKSMVESLEGFPESIKFLSNDKNWSNKAPILSDIIYVDEQYRSCIENYIESYLNYYIADNIKDATFAIELLSKAQKGKANFFILDKIASEVNQQSKVDGLISAIDLVEIDKKYKPLIQYLLRNTFVSESDDIATIDKLTTDDIVVISKSGSYIKRKNILSGGSIGLFEGKKIGRKKNLELLEKEIKKFEVEIDTLNKDLANYNVQLTDLKNANFNIQIQQITVQLNDVQKQIIYLNTKMDAEKSTMDSSQSKYLVSKEKIEALELANKEITTFLNEKKGILTDALNILAENNANLKELIIKLEEKTQIFNEKNIDFIRQQNKLNVLQKELTFKKSQVEETTNQLKSNQSTLSNSESEIFELMDKLKEYSTNLDELYGQKKERESNLTDTEQSYYKFRNQIAEQEDELKKVNKMLHDFTISINNDKDRFNEIKLEINSISERMKVEFNISINDIINNEAKEGLNIHEAQTQVDRMKIRLDTYGEINPMAVDAYNEMLERYNTISTQHKDIIDAKESLIATIKEIEETATTQFMEAFNKVREYFIDVFKSLFNEDDSCDMLLVDPANPLESTINIIAKPKGKRPQSISQLSGGEKTLTATALLFALYLYKPAPFCIFDEVDAPLDDANIEKFNKIIKKFSVDSQFIIVTHNKATMAAVDIIYGVHMPEQGVSAVTPVDFRSYGNTLKLEAVVS